jgi:hypothetical protein
LEVDNSVASDLTTILWSRRLNVGNAVRVQGFVEVVAMIVEVVVEALVDLLQILAELTSSPSLELL